MRRHLRSRLWRTARKDLEAKLGAHVPAERKSVGIFFRDKWLRGGHRPPVGVVASSARELSSRPDAIVAIGYLEISCSDRACDASSWKSGCADEALSRPSF